MRWGIGTAGSQGPVAAINSIGLNTGSLAEITG